MVVFIRFSLELYSICDVWYKCHMFVLLLVFFFFDILELKFKFDMNRMHATFGYIKGMQLSCDLQLYNKHMNSTHFFLIRAYQAFRF